MSSRVTDEEIDQIFELRASGMTGNQIAQKMGMGRSVVHKYLLGVYKKESKNLRVDPNEVYLGSEEPSVSLPSSPTDALPGSEEKIRVLQERLEKGEPLWHPNDRNDFEGMRLVFKKNMARI